LFITNLTFVEFTQGGNHRLDALEWGRWLLQI